jgi:hypothetical protein
MFHLEIPVWVSLMVIFSLISASILASQLFPNRVQGDVESA